MTWRAPNRAWGVIAVGVALALAAVVVAIATGAFSAQHPHAHKPSAVALPPAPASAAAPTTPSSGPPTPGSAAVAASSKCGPYPRPGSTSGGATPADLTGEYGVLGSARSAADRVSARWLRSLPASGIVAGGVRLLARATYGPVYIVPAHHLLSFPLVPARCVAPAKRAVVRSLESQLRTQYAQEALCLLIVVRGQENPICAAAPGTFDPLQYVAGIPAFGIVPNGVPTVRVLFFGGSSRLVQARRNLWIVTDQSITRQPCGVQWLDPTGVVLRTIQYCTRDTT